MNWRVHEKEYLDNGETSFLCHHNEYPTGRQGGVEIIHHNERLAANGFLRLFLKNGREAGYPKLKTRTADPTSLSLNARAEFQDSGLSDCAYELRLRVKDNIVHLSLFLEKPLRDSGVDRAHFDLSWFPAEFWGKTFVMDGRAGVFPREILQQIKGKKSGERQIAPLAEGESLVLCPDEPLLGFRFSAQTSKLILSDERWSYEGAGFSLRSSVPTDKTGEIPIWSIEPASIPGWLKPAMIAVSQAGYHPRQTKQAVIELDSRTTEPARILLERLDPDKGYVKVKEETPRLWGPWLRYAYALFDFSDITGEGVYRLRCGESAAGPFTIASDILSEKAWQPTLAEFFPVQMCHMEVWKGERLWHAACHRDDAMQVPSPLEYIDGYRQAAEPDTSFRPFEHIPHLDQGGWHDAGDTDLAAGSQISTTHVLGLCREEFGVDFDQTTVIRKKNLVEMRQPDGVPDILQQIEHGVLNILGGYRAAGHSFCGIIESIPKRYHQRGEVSAMTDNRVYDPSLKEDEVQGEKSGLKDDRYAFTNRDSALEYAAAGVLALAGRLLKGYNNALSQECLETARKTWAEEILREPVRRKTTYVPHDLAETRVKAAVELFLSTGDRSYLDRLSTWTDGIEKSISRTAGMLGRVWQEITDSAFKERVTTSLRAFAEEWKAELASNPFGISWQTHVWGIGWHLQEAGVRIYYLAKAWPELFDASFVCRVVDWALGCHPGNNISFVSGVGTQSLTAAFGINRADWSYIAGGNASGTALIRPDFPELKTGFPWLWQQSEYVMPGAATWIFCCLAADRIVNTNHY